MQLFPLVRDFRVRNFLGCAIVFVCAIVLFLLSQGDVQAQQVQHAAKKAPLMTRWASRVNPNNPLPEYPRPQLVRADWLNLNGIWEYQAGAKDDAVPNGKTLSSHIVVPFPVESALSGVMEHHDRLWYRRQFTVPPQWNGRQLMLNFGAVDYEAEIFVNGTSVGVHTGGYVPFSYDITPFVKGNGPQELIVRVFDPTDLGGQPRGKQTLQPGGIMYTPTTGIWQTVWLEPVAQTGIRDLHIVPDVDNSTVRITVNAPSASPATRVVIKIKSAGRVIQTLTAAPNVALSLFIKDARLWSPDSPFLYDVDVALVQDKTVNDRVSSYFGMRKISLALVGGYQKMMLNNKFVFEIGPLDQGFWPDGIYTPPSEAALKADIKSMKTFGFNMVRKHIKVEPARWYYWTDKMGLLVWQDMPSANSYTDRPQPIDKDAYIKQLNDIVTTHWNAPSIIMWVIFNEQQGRHDTAALVDMAKKLDPSRLVNRDSGSGYEKTEAVGDVEDVHSYPPPAFPPLSATRALVCGEYGGIGYLVKGHTWRTTGGGYTNVTSVRDLEERYGEYADMLKTFRDQHGLSAAVYTQITDVETELNGLLTYDRVLKCDPAQIARANRFEYPVPAYQEILPTSEKTAQTWKYTFATPSADWMSKTFDASGWQSGMGGFGTEVPTSPRIGTPWTTGDIWLRRTFNPGTLTAEQVSQLVIRDYHDEDIEVYINGVLAYKAGGFISSFEYKPITPEGKKALLPDRENTLAVHCHQTTGGQYIDVGFFLRIPANQ